MEILSWLGERIWYYIQLSGFAHCTWGNIVMITIGCLFMYLAITREYEPLLLLPIGFGIVVGNIPYKLGYQIGVNESGSVLNLLYYGVRNGIYPPLIFLGIGAMTDFSCLIARPKLILLGAAAQIGIFITFLAVLLIGSSFPELGFFDPNLPNRIRCAAAAVGIIGGADGPTAIFISNRLAPDLMGVIAISAYSYMALVPVIQPPIMYLLTTPEERKIKMSSPPPATARQKILFPIIILLVCLFLAPGGLPLIGMLCLGNLLKESGVTERLARTARNAFIDIVTILIGLMVGVSTEARTFLQPISIAIFCLGAFAFMTATAGGVLFAKIMNMFSKDKINPLIGAAGVSAVPDSARVAHYMGQKADPSNFLIMHAMGPNVAGVIGSAVVAGVLIALVQK